MTWPVAILHLGEMVLIGVLAFECRLLRREIAAERRYRVRLRLDVEGDRQAAQKHVLDTERRLKPLELLRIRLLVGARGEG